jgi:ubiquitin-like-conjugating enzyme ATG3
MSTFFQKFHNARESLVPTLTTSAFLSKGVLTPAEFVAAGDELVYKCPTWSWESGDPSCVRAHLPPNKQYLVTRNVPCSERCSTVEAVQGRMTGLVGVEGGEWMMEGAMGDDAGDDDFDLVDADDATDAASKPAATPAPAAPAAAAAAAAAANDDDDEYADMVDFEDDSLAQDTAALTLSPSTTGATTTKTSNVINTRTYDISITYDRYYQTPRVWLLGYSETLQPLSGTQMFQDVMSDYVKRTVTVEKHPHLPTNTCISIHPCQHGAVMKNIVENMTSGSSGTVQVEKYMFIFLKFVASIIPTINYDFTMSVEGATT